MRYPAQSEMWQVNEALRVKDGLSFNRPISRVLATFHQIFPLSLFPDDLIIEELRIIWVRRSGPWTEEVISILATDIACVDAASGPLFGHVHIKNLTGGPEILVDDLFRGNVYKIRSLIEGIVMTARAGLNTEGGTLEEERSNLLKAGSVNI